MTETTLHPTSILVIDDEPKMSGVLARMLTRDGYQVEWTDDPAHALRLLASRHFDIILSDLRMPAMTGLEVLERAKHINPAIDFVMMTAYATPQTAVEAMKKGAIDYLIKPFALEDLKALIRRIEASKAALPDSPSETSPSPIHESKPTRKTSTTQSSADPTAPIIGASTILSDLIARARKVASSNASVLLRGESGTGKEIFARAIHNMSARATGPMIIVNCGAIPESLMESELFGHVRGAFTGATENRRGVFEAAHAGTLFLDEIGELPPHLQVKLLRVLQEGEIQRVGESTTQKVDVRVIAATNRNLEQAVERGEFRQDLYYRLNVIPLHPPPLRERRDDIHPLITHFLTRYSPTGKPPKVLSPEAHALLMRYDYPGNVRELENAIEHAVVLSDSDEIQPGDLPFQIQNYDWTHGTGGPPSALGSTVEQMPLEEVEKRCILAAMEKTRYNHTRAAAHLGITRRTLGYRIQKYGLENIVEDAIRRRREQTREG